MKHLLWPMLAVMLFVSVAFINFELVMSETVQAAVYGGCIFLGAVTLLLTQKFRCGRNLLSMGLVFVLVVWTISESLIFEAVIIVFIIFAIWKRYHLAVIIISCICVGLMVSGYLVLQLFSPVMTEMNTSVSPINDMKVITIYADAGATGGAYRYVSERVLFEGLAFRRQLCSSSKQLEVVWSDEGMCVIGEKRYIP